jgi:hypothetical protein|tara:strand:- start:120 stop:749 length:630 start_codon:yes stop_codon:yes gene_type:complete
MNDILFSAFYSVASGLLIYLTLIVIKQNWVNTIHYLITFLLLPPITFVITNVISNNLALSLGMIGALSIVRFRSPVKNPLELVIFFSLITIGISFGVDAKWGLLLLGIIECILISSMLIEIFEKKFKFFNLFKYTFSTNDGVLKNLIDIESGERIEYLENNPNLVYTSNNNKNNFNYKIALKYKSEIKLIKERISQEKNIINVEVRYGD